MSQLFDEYAAYRTNLLITKSREEGREEGRKEGRLENKREMVQKLSEKGYSIAAIADLLDETEEAIEGWLTQE